MQACVCASRSQAETRIFWLNRWYTDAVVLWDWIISLPREWRFVCSSISQIYQYYWLISKIWKVTDYNFTVSPQCLSQIFRFRVHGVSWRSLICSAGNIDSCIVYVRSTEIRFGRYWVILVVPYVLSIYLKDYTVETCLKVFKVCTRILFNITYSILVKAPVALALWNQAGAEGSINVFLCDCPYI